MSHVEIKIWIIIIIIDRSRSNRYHSSYILTTIFSLSSHPSSPLMVIYAFIRPKHGFWDWRCPLMLSHQGRINYGHAATAWWAQQGPCEPMSVWESQTETDWVCQNVVEWARESQSESEWVRESKSEPERTRERNVDTFWHFLSRKCRGEPTLQFFPPCFPYLSIVTGTTWKKTSRMECCWQLPYPFSPT